MLEKTSFTSIESATTLSETQVQPKVKSTANWASIAIVASGGVDGGDGEGEDGGSGGDASGVGMA